MPTRRRPNEEEEEIQEKEAKDQQNFFVNFPKNDQQRIIGLVGEITEELTGEVLSQLFHLKETGYEEFEETWYSRPIDFVICSRGGDAAGMFAIYDAMRWIIQEEIEVKTFGIGQAMSGGALLLAAGTKGKRRIGRNCRIMIHTIHGGWEGTYNSMRNEMSNLDWVQKKLVECLVSETKYTVKQLEKLFEKGEDIYLDAEEAIKKGFADIIV